jgi:UDP-glucose/GDP-mannose dehydrogenase family, NAD binding domain
MNSPLHLTVLGTGYLGGPTPPIWLALGSTSWESRPIPIKVDQLNAGQLPIYEPGLKADGALGFLREVDAINLRRRTRTADLACEVVGGDLGLLGFVWFNAVSAQDYRLSGPKAIAAFRRGAQSYGSSPRE